MRLKKKLSIGIGFLFCVILIFGALGIITIFQLKKDSKLVLQDNYETLVYNNNMLRAMENFGRDSTALNAFRINLQKQEANVTEPGEREATEAISNNFKKLLQSPQNDSLKSMIRQNIHLVNDLNQAAILRKNKQAQSTSETVIGWLMVIFTLLALIAFTLSINFPSILSEPIRKLSEGISAIVNKDYSKRINLSQKDEFADLANAFNVMAEKLDEYEHSNLAKIKFEKSRIETIINQMNDGVIGLDEKGNILFLNLVAENLLGLKNNDIEGRYAPDIALSNDLLRKLMRKDRNETQLKIFANQKESYFNIESAEVKTNDSVIGQVIVMRNVTPFHELSLAKTNFIATVSHELKTPIAGIRLSTQLLSDDRVGPSNTEQKDLIRNIQEETARLLKITSELLNLSQVETGQLHLKIGGVVVKEMVQEAVDAVHTLFEQKNITLTQNLEPPMPMLQADQEKTTWVLINFLTNAIKHSHENSTIELDVKQKGAELTFVVKDYGQGISSEYVSRVFDRYFRVPGSRVAGTGLGLTISKEFIEAQSGNIWAQSEIGQGSSFGFNLPIFNQK